MYARSVPFLADHPPSIWNTLPHHLWIFFSHLGWGTRSTKYVQRFMGEEPIHRWGYSTGSRATRNHVEQGEIVQARASLEIFIQKALLINRSTKKADTFFYPAMQTDSFTILVRPDQCAYKDSTGSSSHACPPIFEQCGQ